MTKLKSSILDPTTHNEVSGGDIKRNTKGTPNGAFDGFNFLPPGMKIENTPDAVDVTRVAELDPQGPLLSSSQKYGK